MNVDGYISQMEVSFTPLKLVNEETEEEVDAIGNSSSTLEKLDSWCVVLSIMHPLLWFVCGKVSIDIVCYEYSMREQVIKIHFHYSLKDQRQ